MYVLRTRQLTILQWTWAPHKMGHSNDLHSPHKGVSSPERPARFVRMPGCGAPKHSCVPRALPGSHSPLPSMSACSRGLTLYAGREGARESPEAEMRVPED